MELEEFANKLGIKTKGHTGDDEQSYVIDLPDSDAYGYAYIKLENSDIVEIMEDNQVVTTEGSSLMYEALDESILVNLLADWTADIYQIVITRME